MNKKYTLPIIITTLLCPTACADELTPSTTHHTITYLEQKYTTTDKSIDDLSILGYWQGLGDNEDIRIHFYPNNTWILYLLYKNTWNLHQTGIFKLINNELTLIDDENPYEYTEYIELMPNELHILLPTFSEPYMRFERYNSTSE